MRRSPERTAMEDRKEETEREEDCKDTDKIHMSLGAGADVKWGEAVYRMRSSSEEYRYPISSMLKCPFSYNSTTS